MKRVIAVLAVAMLMVFSTVAPALAQRQVGLVNIIIEDVVIAVPVAVAANVCNVNANVIATQILGTQEAVCTADADAMAQIPAPFQP